MKRRERKGKEEKKKGVISEVCVDSFREERALLFCLELVEWENL